MKKIAVYAVCILLFLPVCLSAANITVPTFELSTYGAMDGDRFALSSSGNLDIDIEGGYKFGGRLAFGLESTDLEQSFSSEGEISRMLMFKAAGITIRSLFTLPIDMTYFTGENDTFCSGDGYPVFFGTEPIASEYRGAFYFPAGYRYDGIHTINGTGISLQTQSFIPWMKLFVYGYQDSYLGEGMYSIDVRSMLNVSNFKLETFAGASYPVSEIGVYRAGALLFYSISKGTEFLAQVGIPRWDVFRESLNQDHFFFLFEPRVAFGNFSIIMSLFKYPRYYLQNPTGMSNSYNFNLNFLAGDRSEDVLTGGLESNIAMSPTGEKDRKLTARVFPYLRIISAGVTWDLRLGAKIFPFETEDLLEGYLGIRTEF